MIYDNIKHASSYYSLGEKISKALQYLEHTDFRSVEPGKYEIDGEDIFSLVQVYNTKPLSACRWEAHKKYIDIQYIVEGQEKMGFSESTKVFIVEQYNPSKDCAIYKGNGNFLIADQGHFAIFFPADVHMPSIALNIPKEVKKVVVKVRTDFAASSLPVEEEFIENKDEEVKVEEEHTQKIETSTEEQNPQQPETTL